MSDILKDLNEAVTEIESGIRNIMVRDELYLMLSRAAWEIEALRKRNTDLDWQVNPDRMGGQFTQGELNEG